MVKNDYEPDAAHCHRRPDWLRQNHPRRPTGSTAESTRHRPGHPPLEAELAGRKPNWQEAPAEEFRARVAAVSAGDQWIVSGIYSKARDLLWPRADTLIWLDYPLWIVFPRLFRRTVQRIVTQEDLWGTGNRESWRKQFFSRESLFLWLLQSQPRHRRTYPALMVQPEYAHLRVFHFQRPWQTDAWVQTSRGIHP